MATTDLVSKVREAVEAAKTETANAGFNTSGGTSISKARVVLAQAHLEQALKVLLDNV
jgi:hypothetical protein